MSVLSPPYYKKVMSQ